MISEATRAKISKSLLGRKFGKRPPAAIENMRRAQQERAKRLREQTGIGCTEAQAKLLRVRGIGKKWTPERREKQMKWLSENRDKCRPPEGHSEKLRALYKGKPFSGKTFDHTGRQQSIEERKRRSDVYPKGPNHWNWSGCQDKQKRRHCSADHAAWRLSVFRRDGYKCQGEGCKAPVGTYVTAHHVKPWAQYPDLRNDINNGITLCELCHAKVDKHYRKFRNNGFNKPLKENNLCR